MMIAAGHRLGSTSSPLRRSQRGPTDPGASVLVFGTGSHCSYQLGFQARRVVATPAGPFSSCALNLDTLCWAGYCRKKRRWILKLKRYGICNVF
jgi:hypothetical protein